jgi:hypothetical protein
MQKKMAEYSRLQSRQMTRQQLLADEETIFKVHPRNVFRQSTLTDAVLQLAQQLQQWNGTAAELLDELDLRVAPAVRAQPDWPATGAELAQRLRQLQPTLRARGCEVEPREPQLRRIWSLRQSPESAAPSPADSQQVAAQPIARHVLQIGQQQGEWSGTAAELLDQIQTLATAQEKAQPTWPLNGPALDEQLRNVQSTLNRVGWQLESTTESPRGTWTVRQVKVETPLLAGRLNHLQGRIDNDSFARTKGAKGYYLECLVPNRQIEQHGNDTPRTAASSSGTGTVEGDAVDPSTLDEMERQLIYRIKHTACYWLGLIALDSADYKVAANYVGQRTLEADPEGMWATGARYNLGRAYEAMGRLANDAELLKQARSCYLAENESPQQYGNHWRARRLLALIDADAPGEPETSGP